MQATALGAALEGVQGGIPSEVEHRVSAKTSRLSVLELDLGRKYPLELEEHRE